MNDDERAAAKRAVLILKVDMFLWGFSWAACLGCLIALFATGSMTYIVSVAIWGFNATYGSPWKKVGLSIVDKNGKELYSTKEPPQ